MVCGNSIGSNETARVRLLIFALLLRDTFSLGAANLMM